jgi:thiamine biosynthesis protein ThiS
MYILLNGERQDCPENTTLQTLLDELGLSLSVSMLVVRNDEIVNDSNKDHPLAQGDRVDIVQLVGGGC